MSKKIIATALGAVIALGVGANVMADEDTSKTIKPVHIMKGMEKCYGVAKAGKNDCGSATQACAGQAKADSDKGAWIAVPKGTCDKIVGGTTAEPKS